MGLTNSSTGTQILTDAWLEGQNRSVVCLAGHPNVGKSTIFNTLTGLRQHTGNWAGKTVGLAYGTARFSDDLLMVDLPGMYSMEPQSEEEEIASDFLRQRKAPVVIVASASTLERSLTLTLEILQTVPKAFLCVNLLDEAEKMGISIDFAELEKRLGIPVLGVSGKSGRGMKEFQERLLEWVFSQETGQIRPSRSLEEIHREAARLTRSVVKGETKALSERLDRIITSRRWGIPLILVFLAGIFWLTMEGANIPSAMLSEAFSKVHLWGNEVLALWHTAEPLRSLLMDGIWNTLSWIVAVMLPPMAIFFPLFTFLEDVGYLPRLAFNLDSCFKKCGSCGKQALPMCMGFGCNAAGVVGCRIIQSPRERLLAILTNSFVPCNGRFPFLAVMAGLLSITVLGSGGVFSSFIVLGAILLGIAMTFLVTKLLSSTLLKGIPSSFVLELPPYRMPKIRHILVRSLLDRTLFVLGRAIAVAIPAGILIWALANIQIAGASVLSYCTQFLDPLGRLMGLDGTILMGFLLGLPANEIVLPIILMGYMGTNVMAESSTAVMSQVLLAQGWTWLTIVNIMILCLFHTPCTTTLMSIHKETGSWKWTSLAAVLPLAVGVILCILMNLLFGGI